MKILSRQIVLLVLFLCVGIQPQVESQINPDLEIGLSPSRIIPSNASDEIKKMNMKMLGDGYLITEYIRQDWNGSIWLNYLRETYTYDNTEKLIERLWQLWNTSFWENHSRTNYLYTENNLVDTVTYQDWYENNWLNDFRYVFSYGPSVRSFAINSVGYVFAGTYGGGVFLSTDNGANWTQINNGLTNNLINSLAVNSMNYVFAGTYGDGVFLSTDDGANWTQINSGLTGDIVNCLEINSNN
ncbi:MAG: hypothetical protein IH618_07765, partial [Ignavibacteriaceae bacterium]|nr:hypothetical protein [Ignavibacteriaceae bacterium]